MNNLLFIDDEEGVRRSVVRALKREPYRIHTADSGEAGIAMIRENRSEFNMVVSDYRMPGLDGLETLTRIGQLNPEIVRVILTGYATMEAAIQCTNQGIDGFLIKPFDNLQLRASLRDIAIRKRLRQFVTEQVYSEIENSPGAIEPKFHEATVLFSDIRGFTKMTQAAPPDLIAAFLNDYFFAPMGEIAYEYGGMVDKHMGDAIMVVFGAPMPSKTDALDAVRAAVAMQKKAIEINRRLENRNGMRLRTGIGIATGVVFSGVLGSFRKKEFTTIGSSVNIAARLQGIAKSGEIILNEETYQRVGNRMETERMGAYRVKGVDKPIMVYRIRVE